MHAGNGAPTAGAGRGAPRHDDLAEQKQRVAPECDGDVWSARTVSEHTPRAASASRLHAPRGGALRGPADPGHPSGHARDTVSDGRAFGFGPAFNDT